MLYRCDKRNAMEVIRNILGFLNGSFSAQQSMPVVGTKSKGKNETCYSTLRWQGFNGNGVAPCRDWRT